MYSGVILVKIKLSGKDCKYLRFDTARHALQLQNEDISFTNLINLNLLSASN